jgi:hypothetical protein
VGKLKTELNINEIGKFRFYSGILVGVGFAIVLNVLFRYLLSLANLGTYLDQWSLDYNITRYDRYLIGFSSVAFSFCYTTYLWMGKPFASVRNKTMRLRMAQINPIWIFYGVLLFLLRWFPFFLGLELTIEKDLG